MGWAIELSNKAQKFLDNAEEDLAFRITAKLKEVRENPFNFLEHYEGEYYKLRIGDYSLLIDVNFEQRLLFVAVIDKRGRIYK